VYSLPRDCQSNLLAMYCTGLICPLESDAVVNWAVTPNDSYSAFLTALQSNSSSSSSSILFEATPCATAIMPPTAATTSATTETSDKTGTAVKGKMLLLLLVYL
jgi:hypothetical protein